MVGQNFGREDYLELCHKHNLDPATLKQILYWKSKGFDTMTIARRTGVEHVRVQSYLRKLRELNKHDAKHLLFGAAAIVGGAVILNELLY